MPSAPSSLALPPSARTFHAVIALAALVAVGLQSALTGIDDVRFATTGARVANLYTYFTIASNLLVAVAALRAALGRAHDTNAARALWVAALASISITGLVFQIVLAPLMPALAGVRALANLLLHAVVPVGFVLGWVLYGPRGVITRRAVVASLLFPALWVAMTVVRGALTAYYPYPFLDATQLGAARTALNLLGITGLYLVLAGGYGLIDRARGRAEGRKP